MKKKIVDMRIGPHMTANEVIGQLGESGVFGAGRVSRACDIIEKMISSDATVFLGLAGAMVPAGMRLIFSDLIRDGFVDVVVSTGANITHDLMCSFGVQQWRDVPHSSDEELRGRGISRIYDSFIEEEAFEVFERRIGEMFDLIGLEGRKVSPSDLLLELGKRIDDESSMVGTAASREVPLFVPAFVDSILGMQTLFYSQTHPFQIDVLKDLKKIIDISCSADVSGAILVGGGVPKNFILQSKLVAPEGFKYLVQITTDRPDPGGLSGATLDEAISWGKAQPDSEKVTVYGDATLILPPLIAAVRERLGQDHPGVK
jgi:deoxyhypusine synthase